MPLPMPLEPPTTRTCLPPKSNSFIARPLIAAWFDLSADRCQPCQSISSSEPSMSEFKQLSRSVTGLTVLVTGAASGMGRATARVFAAEGAKVAVTDFAADGTQSVADEITAKGGTAKAWTLDVSNRDEINAVVNNCAAHFGGLDIIVNNAGISVRVAIDDDGYDEAWTKGLAVVLTAPQRRIRPAPPYFRHPKSPPI